MKEGIGIRGERSRHDEWWGPGPAGLKRKERMRKVGRFVLLLQLTTKRNQVSEAGNRFLRVVVDGNQRWRGRKKGCLISPRGSGAEWKSGDVQDKAAPATV
jgi:hypothetical protein